MRDPLKLDKIRALHEKLPAALWRGWNEIHVATNIRQLQLEIWEPRVSKIDTRKGVIQTALDDVIRMRLARLLEKDRRTETGGFEYVKNCWPRGVEHVAKAHDIDLAVLDNFATRLQHARDKTFFHIDKAALGRRDVWADKPITWKEVDSALKALRSIYADLYQLITDSPAPFFALGGPMPKIRKRRIRKRSM